MLVSNQIQRNFIYLAPLKPTIVDQGTLCRSSSADYWTEHNYKPKKNDRVRVLL